MPCRYIAALTFATAFLASTPLHAQERDVHLTMLGSPWWNVGYVAVGGGMAIGGLALTPPTVDVAPLDGLGHRAWNPSVAAVSDVALYGGMGVMLGLGVVVERWGRDARGWNLARAPLVLGESALLALGVVSLVKNAVGECRPRAWDDVAARCASPAREDRVAFPSGHTAPLAAMAGASLGMLLFPTGGRRAYWPLLATATTLALTNLVLRVVAGAHSWVDTATGFALGAGIGLGTAALHTRATAANITVTVNNNSLLVGGAF